VIARFHAGAAALLRQLEAETAHRTAVTLLRHLPAVPAARDAPELAVEAFGLRFANPVGLAAGFDKNAEAVNGAFRLGFGFTEVGTLTPQPQAGNPRPRVFRLPEDAAVINRYGFNNDGHRAARERLAKHPRRTGILGVNVGANKDATDRVRDYVLGVACFADVADYFTLNVSSPNTPGLRDLQGTAALDDLLARVIAARDKASGRGPRRPLLLKIAPDLDLPALDDIVRVARARAIDGMIVSNTTVARPDLLRSQVDEPGGLSGRPLFEPSTRMLAAAFLRAEGKFPLIGVGGIDSAEAALIKIKAGATLIQVYTGMVFAGVGLVAAIKSRLSDEVARTGRPLAAQVGSDVASWSR
jgi:dihydroorotate dehydrogenase